MDNINRVMENFNQKLDPQHHSHLRKVYACVAFSKLASTIATLLHLHTGIFENGYAGELLAAGYLIALTSTSYDGKNTKIRLFYQLAFAFFCGLGAGPFVNLVMTIHPYVIPATFLTTLIFFSSFAIAAMFSNQCRNIYLGGSLISSLAIMLFMRIVINFFAPSLIIKVLICICIFFMYVFIFCDSAIVIKKCRNGDTDFVWHAHWMYLDVIQIFFDLWYILRGPLSVVRASLTWYIFTEKESDKKKT